MFYGPHGTGKTSLARIFAKAWNCQSFNGQDICNKCESCKLINEGKTLDVVEIDAASNNGVEFIRELVGSLQYLPLNIKKKIYIIDEAHNLSSQSWNALLKAIEEPPEHIIFLFLTTQANKVLPTILSRCQKFQFSFIDSKELIEYSKIIAKKENKEIEDSVLKKIVHLSGGSVRELFTLLEQLFLHGEEKITEEIYQTVFSSPKQEKILEFLYLILQGDKQNALAFIDECYLSDIKLKNLFEEIFEIFLDLQIYKKTSSNDLITKIDALTFNWGLIKNLEFLSTLNVLSENLNLFDIHKNSKAIAKVILLNIFEKLFSTEKKTITYKKPEVKRETTKTKDVEAKNTVTAETSIEQSQNEIHMSENNLFSFETIKIFPEHIEGFLNSTENIEYKLEILYAIKFAEEAKSNSNYEKLMEYMKQPNNNVVLVDLIKQHVTRYKIISSDKVSLFIFKNEMDAEKFNEKIKLSEFLNDLNDAIQEKYIWFGLPLHLLKKYLQKTKKTPNKDLDKSVVFSKQKNDIFDQMLDILNK